MFIGKAYAEEMSPYTMEYSNAQVTSTSNIMTIQNHSEITRAQRALRNRFSTIAAFFDGIREADEQIKVGAGRGFVNLYQGSKQFTLELGERYDIVSKGSAAGYTNEMNLERQFYDNTAVGRSILGKSSEFIAETGVILSLPVGVGARGIKLVASSMGTGAVLGGLQATQDGQLSTRLENAKFGAALGLAGGAVGAYVAPKVITFVFRSGASKGHARNVSSPNLRDHARNNFNISGSSLNPNVTKTNTAIIPSYNASNANAQSALNQKMRALEKAQKTAVKIEELPDGRIRYYGEEIFSIKEGTTRGSSFVTEYNSKTGQVRSWMECYDHAGNINRVHPKMIDGQRIDGQHYPPTGAELKSFISKSGAKK